MTSEPTYGRDYRYEAVGDDGQVLDAIILGSDDEAVAWVEILHAKGIFPSAIRAVGGAHDRRVWPTRN